jgi:acyl-CoA reductase-like NAD-dependent aldehyde dehydrogenase
MNSLDTKENGVYLQSPYRRALRDVVSERVAAARHAQRSWAATPIHHRLAMVRRLRRLIAAHAIRLAQAVQVSRGSPLAEILAGEVLPLADACRFLEREAASLLRIRRLGAWGRPFWLLGVRAEVRREPHGTILIIGPFNYPLLLLGVQALQALVAGNSVLLKPGEGGTHAVEEFVHLLREAGLPPQLLQLLPESAEAAMAAIEAGIDKVILTGSAVTGEKVLASLAPYLIPATLELSGCDAAFVLADADLDLTARVLRFALKWNGGATCIAPRRVFVAQSLAGALEARLLDVLAEGMHNWERWKLGPKAEALVRDAITRGARPLCGWGAPAEREKWPTVLADASVTMPLLKEDVFGSVLALVAVSSDEEALDAADRCPYALGATIFGQPQHARALAERVRAGVVVINDAIVPTVDPRLPFGGRGRSGFGVTRGAEGLLEMTVLKVIARRQGQTRWHLNQPDFTDEELVRRYLEAVHGATWKQRCSAWYALLFKLVRDGLTRDQRKEKIP